MSASVQARSYRAGVALAAVTSVLIVWTTIVRDDGTGIGYFMVIMAAAVGGFSARFRSEGMARAMVGVAIMQAVLGMLIATAPSTAAVPGGALKAELSNGVFAALWLIAAILFRAAANADRSPSD